MSTVTITVSAPVGSGKSKLLAEICATLKAIGVPYTFADAATRHGVTADMHEGRVDWIDLYKPEVVLVEVCQADDERPAQGQTTNEGEKR